MSASNYDMVEEQKTEKKRDLDSHFREEEQEEGLSDFKQKEQEEPRHDEVIGQANSRKPGNEGVTFIIMLADGTLQCSPEALKIVAEKIEKIFVNTSVRQDEKQAVKTIGKELSQISAKLADAYFRSSSGNNSEQGQKHLAEEINRFAQAIRSDFVAEDLPDTQALSSTFDAALSGLFSVPVANQSPRELIKTFINLALFSMSVIRLCRELRRMESVSGLDVFTLTIVGSEMYRIADQHGLYRWVQENGGWSGLCTRVCDHIGQLLGRMSGNDNAVSIPWPSSNTIILFGTLTVFVVSYGLYKYR